MVDGWIEDGCCTVTVFDSHPHVEWRSYVRIDADSVCCNACGDVRVYWTGTLKDMLDVHDRVREFKADHRGCRERTERTEADEGRSP